MKCTTSPPPTLCSSSLALWSCLCVCGWFLCSLLLKLRSAGWHQGEQKSWESLWGFRVTRERLSCLWTWNPLEELFAVHPPQVVSGDVLLDYFLARGDVKYFSSLTEHQSMNRAENESIHERLLINFPDIQRKNIRKSEYTFNYKLFYLYRRSRWGNVPSPGALY